MMRALMQSLGLVSAFPVVWKTRQRALYTLLAPSYDTAQPLPWDNTVLPAQPLAEASELRWAPGACEGTLIYHIGVNSAEEDAAAILAALQRVLAAPGKKNMRALYRLINQQSPLYYIDALMEAIPQANLSAVQLYPLVIWLVTSSPDQNVVKFAMAMTAWFSQQRTVKILQVLAQHDELTLYAVVALRTMLDPEEYTAVWFAMMQRVDGWGRVHLMERMPATLNAAQRGWLLRTGYANSVMIEYTAVNCAVYGELLDALASEHDDALLLGCAQMLLAMLSDAPTPDISTYEDGPITCLRYLQHVVTQQPAHSQHYLAAQEIGAWVAGETLMDAPLAQRLTALCEQVLAQPIWREQQ
ncbi:hypothetical protein ACCW76_02100 [Pantoea sp. C8B4]|uniref:hypothetical protein n=1 Tax=Pantoea sp. C8B4 TaxID=3243083 RepID=UPI003ED8DA9A